MLKMRFFYKKIKNVYKRLLRLYSEVLVSTNPARNLGGAGLGWISNKWPDSGLAGAGAKIRYKYADIKNPQSLRLIK